MRLIPPVLPVRVRYLKPGQLILSHTVTLYTVIV